MVNAKVIVYNIGALETVSKNNKLLEFKEVSLKDKNWLNDNNILQRTDKTEQSKVGKTIKLLN